MPVGLIRGYTRHLTPVSPGAARTDPLDRGLVGEWRFDPATGLTLVDYSGYGHHGVASEGPWVTTQYGPAHDFDGDSTEINVGVVALGGNTGTMEIFCKFDATAGVPSAIGRNNYQHSIIITGGEWGGYWRAGGVSLNLKSGVGADTDWHHLAMAYDGNLASANVKLFLDGDLIKTKDGTGDNGNEDDTWRIGTHGNLGAWLTGKVALARLYTRTLSAAEVRARHAICFKRAQPMTHVWMMPWGKTPVAVSAALPVISHEAIHSLVFGGVTVR